MQKQRIFTRTVFFVVLAMIPTLSSGAEIHQSFGPEGRYVNKIHEFDDGSLLAWHVFPFLYETFSSTDNGDSWAGVTHPWLVDSIVMREGIDQQFEVSDFKGTLWAGRDSGKVYRSDNGFDWEFAGHGLPEDIFITRFHKSGGRLFATSYTAKYALHEYNYDTQRWELIQTRPLDGYWLRDATLYRGKLLLTATARNTMDHYLIILEDGEWSEAVLPDNGYGDLKIWGDIPLWIGGGNSIAYSTDGGLTFTESELGDPYGWPFIFGDKMWYWSRSNNVIEYEYPFPAGFSRISPKGLPFDFSMLRHFTQRDSLAWAATLGGILRSSDQGATWTPANRGLGTSPVRDVVRAGERLYAGCDAGLFKSDSYGLRWVPVSLLNERVMSLATMGNRLYAATYTRLLVSDDGGETWDKVVDDVGWPQKAGYKIEAFNDNLYLLVTASNEQTGNVGLYKVNEAQRRIEEVDLKITGLKSMKACGGRLFVNKWVSTDGAAWEKLTGGQLERNTQAYAHTYNGTYYYVGVYDHVDLDHLYRSSDGKSFERFSKGLRPKTTTVKGLSAHGDTVYALADISDGQRVLDSMVLYYSTSSMDRWQEVGVIPGIAPEGTLLTTDYSVIISRAPLFDAPTMMHYDFTEMPEVPDTVDRYEYPEFAGSSHSRAEFSMTVTKPISLTVGSAAMRITGSVLRGKDVTVQILNATGRTVRRNRFANVRKEIALETALMTPGVYITRVELDDGAIFAFPVVVK